MLRTWNRLSALVVAMACSGAMAQSLRVAPGEEVLEGERVQVVAEGLDAGERVALRAERWYSSVVGKSLRLYRSEVRLRADEDGRIDLDRSAPLSGSYAGVDPRGPFWSMALVDDAPGAPADADPREVRLRVIRDRAPELAARVRLLTALAEVSVTPVDDLPGAVFARLSDATRRPALILLGGSEGGGSIAEAAAPFASHGFAVLTLPYFSPADRDGRREIPALPEAMVEIPLEVFDRAHQWLARQPSVDNTRIAVHGTSLGATLALLGAVHFDWIDAVVANVPSDVVIDGWGPGVAEGTRSAFSLRGKPLPFVSQLGYEAENARAERGLEVRVRRAYERGRAARPDLAARARIPVERIRGAVMLIGAYDDQMWPSGMMVQNMAERRHESGLAVTTLLFADAGHRLYETGYAPTTGYHERLHKVGGSPQADAQAQAVIWPGTIRFLKSALRVEE